MNLKNKLDVQYFTQRDNQYKPFISCYPTSMGMAIDHCLLESGLNKTDIGCPEDMQIEDYINQLTMSRETKSWLRTNEGRLGSWIWQYKPRTIAYVEEMIFNKLMNQYGYICHFRTDVTFHEYCDLIDHGLPQVIHGNFKPETNVGGHIICGVGYDKAQLKLIVHDPFGDAHKRYQDHDGAHREYHYGKWFIKNNRNNTMWVQTILPL